ncbi:MAG: hypothetical protein A2388_02005 [Candidatus Veblenbacteria bacterium RIFOXYB1_FULL_43_13]|uniref:Uncharacterized protein n=1 Tax=Candidatus Veblenbacteria bacterium RIFOXYB1_FULL_43_13 TaxID=1802426 RepID=A0A1G2Q327_9BACT|nr:MAG: hypothetical protein A2388_02005 [Candidatus Veblenbacteria bacterium RIFOXYB1_FULL_43_13]
MHRLTDKILDIVVANSIVPLDIVLVKTLTFCPKTLIILNRQLSFESKIWPKIVDNLGLFLKKYSLPIRARLKLLFC